MKKIKKILFIVISISLLKTTAFATKENPNKINVTKEEKEKIIKNHENKKDDIINKNKDKNFNISKTNNNIIFPVKEEEKLIDISEKLNNNKIEDSKVKFNLDENEKEKENLNKINVINDENKVEELEIKIKKILNNFEEFKKINSFEEAIEILNSRKEFAQTTLNNFLFYKSEQNPFMINWNNLCLTALEENAISILFSILTKDEISVIAETLNKLKKEKEYEKVDKSLKDGVNNLLKECYKFIVALNSITSKFDKIFEDIPYEIVTITFKNDDDIIKQMQYKNKKISKELKKQIALNKLFKDEIDFLNKKQPTVDVLEKHIEFFDYISGKLIEENFNYKITENVYRHLTYLDKIIDIEVATGDYFKYLIELLKKNNSLKCNAKEIEILNRIGSFFSKTKEIKDRTKTIKKFFEDLISNAKNSNNPEENPIISSRDKMIESIDKYFESFEMNKIKNIIEKNKALKNLDIYKNMFSEISNYKGETIHESQQYKLEIEEYLKKFRDFKKEFYNPYINLKQKLIYLDLEKEYKQKLDKVEKILRDSDLLENLYSSYIEMMDKLIDNSKMKLKYCNFLEVPIERWESLEPMFKKNKEKIEDFIASLEKNKEKNEKIISSLKKDKNNYDYVYNLAANIEEKILMIEYHLTDLKTFYGAHIENSKIIENEEDNDSLINQFKNIKRKYQEEYYEYFKKSKDVLKSFLKTIPIKISYNDIF